MAATGKSAKRRSILRTLALSVAILVVGGLVWLIPAMAERAETGTAFAARTACGCRYIGERPLADCEKDFEPGMALVSLSEDPDERRITASVPLLASNHATYREGWGCLLEPWKD